MTKIKLTMDDETRPFVAKGVVLLFAACGLFLVGLFVYFNFKGMLLAVTVTIVLAVIVTIVAQFCIWLIRLLKWGIKESGW